MQHYDEGPWRTAVAISNFITYFKTDMKFNTDECLGKENKIVMTSRRNFTEGGIIIINVYLSIMNTELLDIVTGELTP